MDRLFQRQSELISEIERIDINFDKDGPSRKTPDYIEKRLSALESLWGEFEHNHSSLEGYDDKSSEYFTKDIYVKWKEVYKTLRNRIASYPRDPVATTSKGSADSDQTNKPLSFSVPKINKDQGTIPCGPIEELLSQQRTYFRAFLRVQNGIDIESMEEKWEIEDQLKELQHRWRTIDELHLRIDNFLQGSDEDYERQFIGYEKLYNNTKRLLNKRLCSTAHLRESTPRVEIPVFTGKYAQWPTFFDLFADTIHKNNFLSKAQKMQHLKSKVKGEAERLIQHLNISSENYDTAWDLLTHRYNNPHALFTYQIETFLSQPNLQKQSSHELKRLYDTTMECIHAIHNLGVDTTTWDPLLVHLISKKLDTETYSDYKEARKAPRELAALDELMDFIEGKFTALEPINKKDTLDQKQTSQQPRFGNKPSFYNKPRSNHYQAVATYTSKCPLCHGEHDLYQCKRFLNVPADAKMRALAKYQICQNCLYKHFDKQCNSTKRCKQCNGEHNSIIHDAMLQLTTAKSTHSSSSTAVPMNNVNTTKPPSNKQHNVNHVATDDEEVLLTTVSLKVKSGDNTYVTLRALLGQGSQISLISENAAQMLGLQRRSYHASVSGIGANAKQSKGMVQLQCQSIYGDHDFATQALVISRVISHLPNTTFGKQCWPHLKHIKLADPEYNVSRPVDLLLDASIYSDIIMGGLIKGPSGAPIAQQTTLGWILSGNVKTFSCHVVINQVDEISKFWEVEDICDTSSTTSVQDKNCEEFYQATTRRLDNGRYEVALPMLTDFEQNLGASKPKAVMQFKQVEKRMQKNPSLYEAYRRFINEYHELRHMRPADSITTMPTCYLPHHGVQKLDSTTTALRVVFNASAKTTSGNSLNDLMACGPNLQQDLQGLILKWRMHKYVITADIEKMYRQIHIRERDQHLQTIIWRDSPRDLLKEYQLTTVTYGTKAAPFLAIRTLKQIAKDNATRYPLAASALDSSFYMDDLMTGHDEFAYAKKLQNQLIEVLKGAGMNLRKWSSNEPKLIADLSANQLNAPLEFKDAESRKTLGLRWNPSTDTFTFQNKIDYQENRDSHTKRQLLSDISKIYDPLGWLSPVTIKAKILFQKSWVSDIKWDDELPANILQDWRLLREDLKNIENFIIPRYLGNKRHYQLHGFCDASEKAYACAVYLTTEWNKGEYTSHLVAAKTKVAPHSKQVSLPRLELLGAFLLSQLMKKVLESIPTENINISAWTDSMVVLGWLNGDSSRWKQFVANRVRQITDVIPASNWRHVKSEDNSADCATRGLTTANLQKHSLWWVGPQWLTTFIKGMEKPIQVDIPNIEVKKASVNTALYQNNSFITQLLKNNNSITRVARIIGWVSRFITRLRNKQGASLRSASTLKSSELQAAHILIIKSTQALEFEDDINQIKKKGHVRSCSKISSLNPFLDEDEVLRVGGRLANANISYSAKHPVILSTHSRLTELIINQAHITTLHGGPRLTLSFIRDKFWIISGIRTVKKQLRLCVKCRRYSLQNKQQIMADLPSTRVTPSRPFTNTGVDFTGHIEIKANKGRGIKTSKAYVAVFVCLSTKAVHLELVSDLSTAAFLAAFYRMCARRGTPKHVYSDNGTNFVGASRVLKQEYKAILETIDDSFIRTVNEMGLTWHFNAPAWPSAGGLWEAAVKGLKYHLKRVLGEQRLTYEEFITLLYQIEACMNSRPLCPLTESPDDDCLTPGHFLVGDTLLSRPQTDPDSINLPKRWQLVQAINKQFWKKWSNEYLQQLQSRSKWRTASKNLEVNDIVIIKEDNMPPGKWAMGRVLELHPGQDGYVRVVTLKTHSNIIKRPVNKLIILPTKETSSIPVNKEDNQITTPEQQPAVATRTRRRRGNALSHFVSIALIMFMTLFTPSMGQSTESYNITPFQDHQSLYFDKISDLQHIRDEWKLVIFYNLTTYWHGLSDIQQYVTHLKSLCHTSGAQFESVALQLQHAVDEIEHYNSLLKYPNKRAKRGLVNGVGYLANSLFGVLDERFAEQYKEDINRVMQNENHLHNLIKNQTLVIEAEYNILRRNEDTMKQQFSVIQQHLHNITVEVGQVKHDYNSAIYLTSSALAASIILSNLRFIQQTLITTVTDINHGRIDTHFFSPEQLEEQTNIILSQLHGDLTLPTDKHDIRRLYQLLRVYSRIFEDYLIIEIRIPLVSSDIYELDRVLSIPQRREDNMTYRLVPTLPFIAFNLKRDMAFLLSHEDLQSCIHTQMEKILCSLDQPIYDVKLKESVCDIELVNINSMNTSPCTSQISPCTAGQWIKLHRRNDWLYSCCKECKVRIFCPAGMEIRSLTGNGYISLGQGCSLKGETFTIHSHNHFLSSIHQQVAAIEVPKPSVLNSLINSSVPSDVLLPASDNSDVMLDQLKTQIEKLKSESVHELNSHDLHHYSLQYILLVGLLILSGIIIHFWRRRKSRVMKQQEEATRTPQSGALHTDDIRRADSVTSVDHGTSPIVTRKFAVPTV